MYLMYQIQQIFKGSNTIQRDAEVCRVHNPRNPWIACWSRKGSNVQKQTKHCARVESTKRGETLIQEVSSIRLWHSRRRLTAQKEETSLTSTACVKSVPEGLKYHHVKLRATRVTKLFISQLILRVIHSWRAECELGCFYAQTQMQGQQIMRQWWVENNNGEYSIR